MTAENFDETLIAFLDRRPFRVFTVVLKNGQRFEVDGPKVLLRNGVAIYIAPGLVPVYFDHDSVLSLIDAPASADLNRAE